MAASRRQFHNKLPIAAQLSVYASWFGSSYGSPNASSPERDPTPPVMYIFRPIMSRQSVCSVVQYVWSPVSRK